jgi:hypothetical protein
MFNGFPKINSYLIRLFFCFFPGRQAKVPTIIFNSGRLGLVALENFYKKKRKMLFWEALQYGSTPAN